MWPWCMVLHMKWHRINRSEPGTDIPGELDNASRRMLRDSLAMELFDLLDQIMEDPEVK